jgi:hypothetical protein
MIKLTQFFLAIILIVTSITFIEGCSSPVKEKNNIDTILNKFTTGNEEVIISDTIQETNHEIDSIWIRSDFDSAVAVILNGSRAMWGDLKKMDKMYALNSRRILSQKQLTSITDNLSGKNNASYLPSDCFQPYHGIIFYKNGIIRGRFAICFTCGTYVTLPKKNGGINIKSIKHIYDDLKLPTYNWDDSLESGEAKIKYGDFFR